MRLVSGVSLVEPRDPFKTLDFASSRKDANRRMSIMRGIALMDPPTESIDGGASNKFTPEQEKKLEEVALKFYLAIKKDAGQNNNWEPVINAYDQAIKIYDEIGIDPSEFRKDFSARSQKKAIELDGDLGQEICCRGQIVIAMTEAFFPDSF